MVMLNKALLRVVEGRGRRGEKRGSKEKKGKIAVIMRLGQQFHLVPGNPREIVDGM